MKDGKLADLMDKEYRESQIIQKSNLSVHNYLHKMVLNNVYRGFYDIENERGIRKPDELMKTVVDSSEALERARDLQELGLHPSLIFFDKSLYDN